MRIDSPFYQRAFQRYLRYGISIDVQLKAAGHETTHYVWHTQGDDKARPEHAARAGQVFAWNDPSIRPPGSDPGCRCTAEPYDGPADPPIDPVFPELALLPLFRVGRLLSAWRAIARQRAVSRSWTLGSHKSAVKWRNRLEKGDWTPAKITRIIRQGKPYRAPNKPFSPNTATGYELGGDFVVVDDITNEIIQVSEPGYLPEKLP